ncbi:MAG: serine hydrolase domain-containing protein [Bacteroidota bacterium]
MKPQRLTLLLFLAIFFFRIVSINAQPQQYQTNTVTEAQLDQLFEDWSDVTKPGMAVAVLKDGKIAYAKGFGSANLEYDIPITPTTIFHSASLSKQFTAFAILLLQQEGKLSLDDDVRKHLPELPDFGHTITLRHLASHSSGLRDQWRLLELAGWRLDDVITTDKILGLVERQKGLNFTPGDENRYSNTGFTLLAQVVERLSGQSFADFTAARIFQPLGMVNTQFYDNCEKIVKNRAYSYKKTDEGFKKSILSFSNVGPTSLFTTAEDMTRWALNFEQPKVGNRALIDQLNTPFTLNNGEKTGYALGQFTDGFGDIRVYVHSGSDAGYRAYFARIPAFHLSVVVLANLSSIDAESYTFQVTNLYLEGQIQSTSSSEERTIFQPDPKTFINLSNKQLKQFEGEYFESSEWYKRKLYVKNDTLIYYRSASSESKLAPIAENTFKMLGDTEDVTLMFTTNKAGEPQLEFYVNDREPITFLRYTEVDLNDYVGIFHSEELNTSYSFVVENGTLVLKHPRRADVALKPIQKNVFTSDNRNYKFVEFTRNDRAVSGLSISNWGAWDVRFDRVKQ